MTVLELKQKRGKAVEEARAIFARADNDPKGKRSMTAEEQQQFDRLMAEAKDLGRQITAMEGDEARRKQLDDAEAELRSSSRRVDPDDPGNADGDSRRRRDGGRGRGPDDDDDDGERGRRRSTEIRWNVAGAQRHRVVALAGARAGDDYGRAYRSWLRDGDKGPLQQLRARAASAGGAEARDLQADLDDVGGFMIAPTQMMGGLLRRVDDAVFIRQLATVTTLTAAKSLGIVSLDADPDDGEWTSELKTGTNDDKMRLGKREMTPHPLAKRILLSRKLLRLAPEIENEVISRFAYKFGVTEEKNYLLGDGANKPLGLFVAHPSGISTSRDVSTGNTATEIRFDGLIRAKMALKQQYRRVARWLFHRDAVTQISILKDGNGQYLWRQGLTTGEPDTILGLPVIESEFAPNTFTTGRYVGLLGDFSFYHIVESLAMQMQRLDELYSESNQVGFIARRELDAQPVLEEAFVRVRLV